MMPGARVCVRARRRACACARAGGRAWCALRVKHRNARVDWPPLRLPSLAPSLLTSPAPCLSLYPPYGVSRSLVLCCPPPPFPPSRPPQLSSPSPVSGRATGKPDEFRLYSFSLAADGQAAIMKRYGHVTSVLFIVQRACDGGAGRVFLKQRKGLSLR